LADLAITSMSGTFKAAKDIKAVRFDLEDLTKTIQVEASLGPN
jgi:hypothetical protein